MANNNIRRVKRGFATWLLKSLPAFSDKAGFGEATQKPKKRKMTQQNLAPPSYSFFAKKKETITSNSKNLFGDGFYLTYSRSGEFNHRFAFV